MPESTLQNCARFLGFPRASCWCSVFVGLMIVMAMRPAEAQLRFCNLTKSEVQVATSIPNQSGPRTDHGWYNIPSSECRNLVAGPLQFRYYYFYAKRYDGAEWAGDSDKGGSKSCVSSQRFEISEATCPDDARVVTFRRVDTEGNSSLRISLTHSGEKLDVSDRSVRDQACEVLNTNLDRPRLRSERVTIARYTDVLTPPQTRTQCTNVYDTGVPDPSTCSTECVQKWRTDFPKASGCMRWETRCSNVKACNAWRTDKKTMQCELYFQLKLPNYVEKPLSSFIDTNYKVLESAQRSARDSLPLACAPVASSGDDVTKAVAEQITNRIKEQVRDIIRREAEQWLTETAIQTIVASIPSGGTGGAAVMSTQLGQFVYRTHKALRPVIKVANEAKEYAQDVGFDTACSWSDWHRF